MASLGMPFCSWNSNRRLTLEGNDPVATLMGQNVLDHWQAATQLMKHKSQERVA